jgi:hypothetical protein
VFTPPNENLIWAVHRFRSSFRDDLGNTRVGVGTGFWISDLRGGRHFVTNKHNVDAALMIGESTFKLECAEIELRKFQPDAALPERRYFQVQNLGCLRSSAAADCAVFTAPTLVAHSPEYPVPDLTKFKDIATEADFAQNVVKVMEPAIFIGFPGAKGHSWSDSTWGLPIARECSVASWPGIAFTHPDIPTQDTVLLSGLSFSGSSGSPVFVQNRGIRPGGDIEDSSWRPAKLVGIMSGHFRENVPEAPMFAHTGLSYLTRSTSIIQLFQQVMLW